MSLHPRACPPSFEQTRDGRHLLVWGELAQWMVVDGELRDFLRRLDGRRAPREAVREHARRWKRPVEQVARDVLGVLDDLSRRGIVGEPPPLAPEPLSIANVTLNLTNRCNLRCPWCYNAGRASPEAPIEALMDALEAARGLVEPDATFIVLGGEPLLAPERLLTALRRAEAIFTGPALVSTNGTLLREPLLEGLAERRVEVQVSIDSPDPARHDAGRGPGVHAQALGAVERLAKSGLRTIVSMVYARDSLDEIEPFLDMAANAGAHEARLIPLRGVGGGREHAARRPDQLEVLERLLEILERRPELRGLLGRDYFSILMAICRASGRRTGCGIARRVVMLDADGEVYPCPNHARPEHRCGSVLAMPLERIFRESPVLAGMRETYRVEKIQACRDCAFRHWCAGDCRGESLAVSGIPTSPSPHCAALRQVFPKLLWLLAEGDARLQSAAGAPRAFV